MAAPIVLQTVYCLVLNLLIFTTSAQEYELELKHYEVCDPKNFPEKQMDTALLTIHSSVPNAIVVWTRTSECHTCNLDHIAVIEGDSNCTIKVDTRWPMRYRISHNHSRFDDTDCSEATFSFREYGDYTLFVHNTEALLTKLKCEDEPILGNAPADSNIPIYVAIGVFIVATLLWVFILKCQRNHWWSRLLIQSGAERLIGPNAYTSQDLGSMQTNINHVDNEVNRPRSRRLKSLDTFRGISIVVMIFVNFRGGGYYFFNHSKWNSINVADLVFPWFVFIMGTSMTMSFSGLLRKATPKYKILFKIFKRSCILFVLGLVVNTSGSPGPPDMSVLRIPGVLQRFAGTYLITASLHLIFVRSVDVNMHAYWSMVRDILDYWLEWIISLSLLAAHIAITFGLHVPGCPKGYLGPGGEADGGKYKNCTGGAASHIDRLFFGSKHIYQHPTCKEIYNTHVPHDPEGLLGTLTSCFICYLGLQAGKILIYFDEPKSRVKRFLIWGFMLCLIAGILCKFSKNDGWIPINKNLWSVSFVLCMAGFAFILLSFCYLTIDVWKIWNGAPFYYPGMNAIALYMGHEVLAKAFPITWGIGSPTHFKLLPRSVWATLFWVCVAFLLYIKNIFVTV